MEEIFHLGIKALFVTMKTKFLSLRPIRTTLRLKLLFTGIFPGAGLRRATALKKHWQRKLRKSWEFPAVK